MELMDLPDRANEEPGRDTLLQELGRQERYRKLVENSGDVLWSLSLKLGRFTYVSPSVFQLRGLTADEAMAETLDQSMCPESHAKAMGQLALRIEWIKAGNPAAFDPYVDVYDQPCKDGSVKHIEISTMVTLDEEGGIDELIGVSRDATPRVEAQKRLSAALAEKELLLAELTHRVKNNLAMTASFLSFAEPRAVAPEDAALLRQTRDRIHALSLVYDMISRTSDATRSDVSEYLKTLGSTLVEGLGAGRSLRFEFVGDELPVPTRLVVAIGLSVNELISNAVKYAFLSRPGRVKVSVLSGPAGLEVVVEDDGVGLPAGFQLDSGSGLGVTIVRGLVEREGGAFSVRSEPGRGTAWRLTFPDIAAS
jgi:PAS domain S-box-containing protein